eukprot:TRINITY_DN4516_c0_g1_i1.p2 TRINITY_DN4516_c0_g1~~TRINITY_DN4516_c0_g1_i1.p2  ORF type:complete len:117 (+),score=25.78 TRINITY_DN4516_c0_g1_i1:140-490(+)
MDEQQFRRLLDMFPVVRSRDFCAENEAPVASSSQMEKDTAIEWQNAWEEFDVQENSNEKCSNEDPFWEHLRSSIEKKFGSEIAMKFSKAFQKAHNQLVYSAIPLETARKIASHSHP